MRRNQHGQALVLVLLSLAVVLTIVLFILARSVTDVAVSSRSEEAVRAFSAAEAGIENALVVGTGTGGQQITIGNAVYSADVTQQSEGKSDFNYLPPMFSGDAMTAWYVAHLDAGGLGCSDTNHPCFSGNSASVCWGTQNSDRSAGTVPAIEVSTFYETTPDDPATIQIKRETADPSTSGRAASTKFDGITATGCTISGTNYAFRKDIDLSVPGGARLLFSRVRMFYNTDAAQLGVTVSGGVLPSQGQNIISTGTAGISNRRVEVFQGWPEPPAVFDYALYGGGTGLTK